MKTKNVVFSLRKLFLLLVLLFCLQQLQASESIDTSRPEPRKTLKNFMNPDSLSAINFSIIPIPILTSSPETGLRFGLALDYFFNAKENEGKEKNEARGSFIFGQVTYSTMRQLDLSAAWQVFTKGEKWVLRGRAGYSSFAERVWGIGMQTVPEDDYWDWNYERTYWDNRIFKLLKGSWYAGLSVNYSNTYRVRYSKPITPAFNYSDGVNGGLAFGFGPAVLLEKRDFPFSARKGAYFEAVYQNYLPMGANPYAYQEWIIDFRKFYPLAKENTFGYQLFTHITDGDVPLRELPRIGSANLMRGYFGGRFRNKTMSAAQAEYRFQIWRWIHASVFTAGAFSAPTVAEYSTQDFLWTGGAGLRFLVNKKNRMFIRVDYARNSTFGGAFYFRLNDAF